MKKIPYIILLVAVALVFMQFFIQPENGNTEADEISVENVMEKQEQKEEIVLLDVRTPSEFNGPLGHLEGAILIPINELKKRLSEIEKFKDKEIIVYCRSGNRSDTGMKILKQEGYNALNMLGGMRAYRKYEKNKK